MSTKISSFEIGGLSINRGDLIWHYEMREPLTVIKMSMKKGDRVYTFQDKYGNQITVANAEKCIEFVPKQGDVVVILAGRYYRWMDQQIAQLRGSEKAMSISSMRLEKQKNAFPIGNEFDVRFVQELQVNAEQFAVISSDGESFKVPIGCLAVLKRANAKASAGAA